MKVRRRTSLLFVVLLLFSILYYLVSSYFRRHYELVGAEYDFQMEENLKYKMTHQSPIEGRDYESVRLKYFPVSDVYCYGREHEDRTCRLKNVCYDNVQKQILFFKSPMSSWLGNVPGEEERKDRLFYDSSTLVDYKEYLGDVTEVDPRQSFGGIVHWVPGLTILHTRVLPTNIMHFFHDDFVGLFDILMEYATTTHAHAPIKSNGYFAKKSFLSPWLDLQPAPFDKNTSIFFFDDYHNPASDEIPMQLYAHLTEKPLLFRNKVSHRTCFAELLAGPSKRNTWYEYGLRGIPQGPLMINVSGTFIQKPVDGLRIRRMTEHIMAELNLAPLSIQELKNSNNDDRYIVIFSRSRNRLILNEQEMSDHLGETFKLPVRYLRMEENTFSHMVQILSRAKLIIGMHGSALILSMFLPPGAVLLELFPLGVPAKDYTPYRTLANLPGMSIIYGAWENKHADANIAHKSHIAHLPIPEQEKIISAPFVEPHLCCDEPSWRYHIYQDTRVNLAELTAIISPLLETSASVINAFEEKYLLA